jgi:hypothetical protein
LARPPNPFAIAGLLCLAACATQAPVETDRAVAGDPATVRGRVAAELTRLGLSGSGSADDGAALRASTANAPGDWASCPPTLVGSGDDGRRLATADREQAQVTVGFVPVASGTRVSVQARFAASYRNPISGYAFERNCRSNGVLERRILAAAAG